MGHGKRGELETALSRVSRQEGAGNKRFGTPIFRIRRSGRKLVLREPKYSSNDPNCCPSRYRDRTLRWTATRIKATTRIRRAPNIG